MCLVDLFGVATMIFMAIFLEGLLIPFFNGATFVWASSHNQEIVG